MKRQDETERVRKKQRETRRREGGVRERERERDWSGDLAQDSFAKTDDLNVCTYSQTGFAKPKVNELS